MDLVTILMALALLLAPGCGSSLTYLVRSPAAKPAARPMEAVSAPRLDGRWVTTEGKRVDLAAIESPIVLIFAQDTCIVCNHEADAIRKSLSDVKSPPKAVRIFTVLVGAEMQDAADWKADHAVPWEVGVDSSAALFKKTCDSPTVPCIVVQVPDRGIILRKIGSVSPRELQRLTGSIWGAP